MFSGGFIRARPEGGGGVEAVGTQDVGDASVEAFDHAVGLRDSRLDQVVFDVVASADPIEGMGTGWLALAGGAEAVGKFLAVVGEDLADRGGGYPAC